MSADHVRISVLRVAERAESATDAGCAQAGSTERRVKGMAQIDGGITVRLSPSPVTAARASSLRTACSQGQSPEPRRRARSTCLSVQLIAATCSRTVGSD